MPQYKDHHVGLQATQHSQEFQTVTVLALQALLPDHILTVHAHTTGQVLQRMIYMAVHVAHQDCQEIQRRNSQVSFH